MDTEKFTFSPGKNNLGVGIWMEGGTISPHYDVDINEGKCTIHLAKIMQWLLFHTCALMPNAFMLLYTRKGDTNRNICWLCLSHLSWNGWQSWEIKEELSCFNDHE